MPLGERLTACWRRLQGDLYPALGAELGPLGEGHRHLVTVLELVRPERFLAHAHGARGRPVEDRAALARSFIAKAVLNISETEALIERLRLDRTLRRLCGWDWAGSVPSASTFSRAFAAFAACGVARRLHEALILETQGTRLVGHSAARRRPGGQAERQGLPHPLDRRQVAHGRGRRRHTATSRSPRSSPRPACTTARRRSRWRP